MNSQTPSTLHNLKSVFTAKELSDLRSIYNTQGSPDSNVYKFEHLGRLHTEGVHLPEPILDKLTTLVRDLYNNQDLTPVLPPLHVEYSAQFGNPNLPPHFDGDTNCLILDYQLESNTDWPIGADLLTYPLSDNDALIFNPNTTIHWRPIKEFKPGEYVKMIFLRFNDPHNPVDYSDLPNHQDDEVFREVQELRSKL